MTDKTQEMTISVKNLSFQYKTPGYESVTALKDISFALPPRTRCLLIGANGAGKSTLLRILAGKHLLGEDTEVLVLGKSAFYQTLGISGITFLGQHWVKTVAFAGNNVPYQADIPVCEMMPQLQAEHKERRDELYSVLEINPAWRMHQVSDGQRRRVQIMLGLLRPFKVLLLDEITVDLDVLARRKFLKFLEKDCERNEATIIYATHIFDGLEEFPTHVVLLEQGELIKCHDFHKMKAEPAYVSLYQFVVSFLEDMWRRRKALSNGTAAKGDKEKLSEFLNEDEPFSERVNSGFTPGRMLSYFK